MQRGWDLDTSGREGQWITGPPPPGVPPGADLIKGGQVCPVSEKSWQLYRPGGKWGKALWGPDPGLGASRGRPIWPILFRGQNLDALALKAPRQAATGTTLTQD